MATPTKYTHSIASDFGGAFDPDNWEAEIRAPGSGVVVQVDHVIRSGDVVDTWFKDVLPAGEETALDALPAAHDSTPPVEVTHVQQDLEVGGMKTDTDGVSLSVGESSFAHACYVVPEAFHVQGTVITWTGFKAGDYGWLAVVNPAGEGTVGAAISAAQANVTVASGKGAYYDPANGAAYLEIWTSGGELKEVRKIASVSGDVVTLDSNVSAAYDDTHVTKVRVDGFAPVRGAAGLDGGFRLVGSGSQQIKNEAGVSAALSAGLLLCARVLTGSGTGTRELAVAFIFRKPLG